MNTDIYINSLAWSFIWLRFITELVSLLLLAGQQKPMTCARPAPANSAKLEDWMIVVETVSTDK